MRSSEDSVKISSLKTIYQYNHFNIDIHVIIFYNFSMYQCFRKSHFYENGRGTVQGESWNRPLCPVVNGQFLQSNAGNESFISFCLINQFHAFVLRVYPQRNECKWRFANDESSWILIDIEKPYFLMRYISPCKIKM